MNILQKTCLVFTIAGAINWGLVGLFNFNLVSFIFSFSVMLQNLIYIIIGVCGLVNIAILFMNLTDGK